MEKDWKTKDGIDLKTAYWCLALITDYMRIEKKDTITREMLSNIDIEKVWEQVKELSKERRVKLTTK